MRFDACVDVALPEQSEAALECGLVHSRDELKRLSWVRRLIGHLCHLTYGVPHHGGI